MREKKVKLALPTFSIFMHSLITFSNHSVYKLSLVCVLNVVFLYTFIYHKSYTNHFSTKSHFSFKHRQMRKMSVIFKHG